MKSIMEHNMPLTQIRIERGQHGQFAPDALIGHVLADQMVAPGDATGAGHVVELLGLVRACKSLKISDVLPLSPSGVRVRESGNHSIAGGVPPGCETGWRRLT